MVREIRLGYRSPIVSIAADKTKAGASRAVGGVEEMAAKSVSLRDKSRDVQTG
jgi:hypothetical protein